MTTVVFTGAAALSDDRKLLRAALTKAANKAGIAVLPTWKPTCDYLVASRNDTVKARGAEAAGKTVFSYDQFVKHLSDLGVDAFAEEFTAGVKPNQYTDIVADVSQPALAEAEVVVL